jgi:hypothetical protein
MTATLLLNIIGLICNFTGTLMMFFANNKVTVNAGQLPDGETLKELSQQKAKTRLFRAGMLILSIGFICQLFNIFLTASVNIPSAKPSNCYSK